MINVVIIEDEIPSLNRLLRLLNEVSDDIKTVATLSSVEEGIIFFRENVSSDLILSDIQLCDGLSFEIFSSCTIHTPVVFFTGFDRYMHDAFTHNGIDYLLKPIEKDSLKRTIKKYINFQAHFTADKTTYQNLSQIACSHLRTRLQVKKGIDHISLKLDDVVLLYTSNRIVYVIDKDHKKYVCDKILSDLEHELPKQQFFRANRQYIVNVDFIKGYKPYEKVKLLIDVNINLSDHLIIVSQENASTFKTWIEGI